MNTRKHRPGGFNHHCKSCGFTLMQTMVAVTVVAIISTVAYKAITTTTEQFREAKLDADARSLNDALAVYALSNGDLYGTVDLNVVSAGALPGYVLSKLQTKANDEIADSIAGISGRMADTRLRAVMQTPEEAATSKPRVVFDPGSNRFVLATSGLGVKKFVLADKGRGYDATVRASIPDDVVPAAGEDFLTALKNLFAELFGIVVEQEPLVYDASGNLVDYTSYHDATGLSQLPSNGLLAGDAEHRDPTLKLSLVDGWIWDYNEQVFPDTPSPTFIATPGGGTASVPGVGSSGGGGGSGGSGLGNALAPPVVSTAGGDFVISEFDFEVSLSNANAAGASRILYRTSGNSGWVAYDGSPLVIAPGTTIDYMSESLLPDTYDNSQANTASFNAIPIYLEAPVIQPVATQFDYGANEDILVYVSNPNSLSYSTMEYRINGSGWQAYSAPFNVNANAYLDAGALVEARVRATPDKYPEYYFDSPVSATLIAQPVLVALVAPGISFSNNVFCVDVATITATLFDPNPQGAATIYYQIVPVPGGIGATSAFAVYSGPFDVTSTDYPEGFGVRTYAAGTTASYSDSPIAERYTESDALGLQGGHFDLDTSSFISSIGNGSTDGHVHEYDVKQLSTGADLFNLNEGKLQDVPANLPSADTKFKVIVANADLSPGGRLALNTSYVGGDYTTFASVTSYDDTPVAALPVYSLSGIDGTTPLSQLGIFFDPYTIANAGLLPTNTGDLKANVAGKNGEWRNGALTIQLVLVNADGSDGFTLDNTKSAGGHGVAASGLLHEATVFWHWSGDSYHQPGNTYIPGDASSVAAWLEPYTALPCDTTGGGGGTTPDPNVDPTVTPCPSGGLIAEYEWKGGVYEFKNGVGDVVSFTNLQYAGGDVNKPIQADFNSNYNVDMVEVETDKNGKNIDSYPAPVTSGGVMSNDVTKTMKRMKFYCVNGGANIDPNVPDPDVDTSTTTCPTDTAWNPACSYSDSASYSGT
ncbi:MAG: type II secretion system protein, partial [Verrucomicrobiales bacterium]